ncbi:hypothetical protein PoB_002132300 [Plakobranchus ocellatus]|uniref:Uncharacterized protein n=1 Tax=Plakobranchus ocellatus TaxID=259542 RepID=A0AAV3ZJ34_9GAST|nr:hypothetical protein PoB_002132300 [Plakobranchus ocellatus]
MLCTDILDFKRVVAKLKKNLRFGEGRESSLDANLIIHHYKSRPKRTYIKYDHNGETHRVDMMRRCSTLERLYPGKTLESTWRPPETPWSLYSGRQIHSEVCLAAAKTTLESVWRLPD